MSATRPPTRPSRRRPTTHAPGPPAGRITDDDDRRQRAKQYWPIRRERDIKVKTGLYYIAINGWNDNRLGGPHCRKQCRRHGHEMHACATLSADDVQPNCNNIISALGVTSNVERHWNQEFRHVQGKDYRCFELQVGYLRCRTGSPTMMSATRSTQPSTLRGTVKWVPAKGRWCSAAEQ